MANNWPKWARRSEGEGFVEFETRMLREKGFDWYRKAIEEAQANALRRDFARNVVVLAGVIVGSVGVMVAIAAFVEKASR